MNNIDLERALADALDPIALCKSAECRQLSKVGLRRIIWSGERPTYEILHMTTDGNAMIAMVEAMRKKGLVLSTIEFCTGDAYWAAFESEHGSPEDWGADAKTLPLAVARAAAKALRIWKE